MSLTTYLNLMPRLWMGRVLNVQTFWDMTPCTIKWVWRSLNLHTFLLVLPKLHMNITNFPQMCALLTHLDYTFKLSTNWHVAIVLSYWNWKSGSSTSNSFLPPRCFCATPHVWWSNLAQLPTLGNSLYGHKAGPAWVAHPSSSIAHNTMKQRTVHYVHIRHVGCPQ